MVDFKEFSKNRSPLEGEQLSGASQDANAKRGGASGGNKMPPHASISSNEDLSTAPHPGGSGNWWLQKFVIVIFLILVPCISNAQQPPANKAVKTECRTTLPKNFQEKFERAKCFAKVMMFSQQIQTLGCCKEDSECVTLTSVHPEMDWGCGVVFNKSSDISGMLENRAFLIKACPNSNAGCLAKNIRPVCREGRCIADYEINEEAVEKMFEEKKEK